MKWVKVPLQNILSLEYGASLPAGLRVPGEIPVAGSNGISGFHDKALVTGPGIVVGRKGSAGKVTWFSSDFWPIDTTYYVSLKQKAEMRFLYYLLTYLNLERFATSTGVPGLTRNDAYKQTVPFVPITEQHRIVEILDQADQLRKLRAEADRKAERILPALFIKMFGDPATNSMGWKFESLGKLSLDGPQYGANASSRDWQEGMPRYVRITDIREDGALSDKGVCSIELENWEPYKLDVGDFLFARSGNTVGKTYLYRQQDGLCAYAGYLIRFKLNSSKINPWFAFVFTQTNHYKNWILIKKRVAGQPNINGQEYSSLLLPTPPIDLQNKFGESVEKALLLQSQSKESANKLGSLFNLLLHRAFSGDLTAAWREAHMKELLAEMEQQAKYLN